MGRFNYWDFGKLKDMHHFNEVHSNEVYTGVEKFNRSPARLVMKMACKSLSLLHACVVKWLVQSLFESNLHSIWESCMSALKYFNLSISFHIFPMSHLSPTHTHQCSSRPRSCLTYLDLMHPGARKQGSGNAPLPSVAPNFRSTIRWPVRKSTLKKNHPAPPPHVLAPFWFWISLKRRTSSRAAASCTMPFWSMELSKLQIQHFTP